MTTLRSLTPWQKLLLNLTRGVAAQMVVLGHAGQYFLPDSAFPFDKLGPLGVLIFFLISGYLIAHCVLDNYHNPAYDFGRFLTDRASRILTPFIPALFLVAVLDSFVYTSPAFEYARNYNVVTWMGNLLMLQDYPLFQVLRRIGSGELPWFIAPFGSGRPFWTLNMEWALYLVFGGALFFLVRGDRPASPGTVALIAFFAVIPVYHFAGGFGEVLIYAWLMGMSAAFLDSGQLRMDAPLFHRSRKYSATIKLGLIFAPWLIIGVRTFAQQLLVLDLTFAVLLTISMFALFWQLGTTRSNPRALFARTSAGLAHYSYSLYLLHNSVVVFLAIRFFPDAAGPGYLLVAFVASQLLAIPFWWLFERHYKHVRRFLNRRRPVRAMELAPTSSPSRN